MSGVFDVRAARAKIAACRSDLERFGSHLGQARENLRKFEEGKEIISTDSKQDTNNSNNKPGAKPS